MKNLLAMMVAVFFGCPLFATTWYVNGTSGSDGYSGKGEDSAKKTIQAAIDASSSGDTILVAAGTYAPIVTGNKVLTVKSQMGPKGTIIDGRGTRRCAKLIEFSEWDWNVAAEDLPCGSTLDGFTLMNGYAEGNAGVEGGTVKNCIITGNYGWDDAAGGGFAHFYNCLIRNNRTTNWGGGPSGAAIRHSTAYNCTIVRNTSEGGGGAISQNSKLVNCIVAENYDGEGRLDNVHGDSDDVSILLNCCVAFPGFVNSDNGDYRLAANSPCIDAGDNAYVMDETDLAGGERIVNGRVDIGCYEYRLSEPLDVGLVAWYKFDGNANDSSGNGNNGVVHGATLTTDRLGKLDGAYSFDGDDWVQVANSDSLSLPTKTMSFCVWMRTEVDDGWIPFLSKGTYTRQYGFELAYGNETTLFINDYNGTGCGRDVFVAVDSVSLNSGAWHFVVLTYDGSEIKAYVNGNLIASRSVEDSFGVNSSDLYIGKDMPGTTEYFSGAMDDLRIYNRALSAAEVKALYGEADDDLVAYYKFDGNANDSSGNGHNLIAMTESDRGIVLTAPKLTFGRDGSAGGAYEFSGNSELGYAINAEPHDDDFVIKGTFSYSVWFKTSVPMSSYGDALTYWNPGNDLIFGENGDCHDGASVGLRVGTDGVAVVEHAGMYRSTTLEYKCPIDGDWHHAVVTVENNGASKLYLDGCYVGEGENNGRAKLFWGKVGGGAWGYYTGCIDDFSVYNRALSAAEVKALYEGENDKGLVAWYKFDGNANDSSGSGHNLVNQGAVAIADRFGQSLSAYYFDGSSQLISANDVVLAKESGTIACWIKTDAEIPQFYQESIGGTYYQAPYVLFPTLGDDIMGTSWTYAGIGFAAGSNGIMVFEHSGYYLPASLVYESTIGSGWNHIVISFENDGAATLFVNGVSVKTGLVSSRKKVVAFSSQGQDSTHEQLGGIGGGCYGNFSGCIDDFRVYNRALSVAEVKALYEGDGTPVVTKCAVTFDAAGGTAEWTKGEVVKGAAVGTLPAATREGYEFLGWYTAADGGTQVTAATVVTADVTFYAQWRESSGGGDDSKWKYVISGGRAIVTGVKSASGVIVMPSELGGYPVVAIGASAFDGCEAMTAVTIPSSVTSIGEWAFAGCSGLTSVTIPSSVTSIGDSAFYGCSGLTSVTIPPNVTDIGAGAFAGCEQLMSVEVCGGVIGDEEFSECVGLETVVLHEGVTKIGSGAFSGCVGLTSVTTPSSVKSIGEGAFSCCTGLTRVLIQGGAIGEGAFAECEGLTTMEIVGGDIGESAFSECRCLETVVLHEGVTTIGSYAFTGCVGLTSVTTPSSVKSIDNGAFDECVGLARVVIHGGAIGESAFSGCEGLTTVEIGTGVTSIGCGAFLGAEALNEVVIRSGSIGDGAFQGCQRLTSVELHEGVTGIGEYAFKNCIGLRSIEIPKSVVNIGFEAFHGCIWLDSVVIRGGAVGEAAFEGCHQLRSVVFYEGVTKIGEHAFVEVPGPFYFLGRKPETVGDVFSAEVIPVDPRVIYFKRGVSGWTDGGTWQGLTTYSWDGVIVTCVFDANGGVCSVASKEYVSGSALQILPTATREEYEFLGWFTAADGGTQVTAATAVTADVTYYAQWKWAGDGEPGSNECYKVSFNANGGNMSVPAKTIAKGAAVGELPILARDGYEFLGWFTVADGGMQVTAATVVTADVTFYAQWKAQVPDIAPKEDQPMDAGIANVYDGVITDADGLPIGSVNVKAGKISNSGVSKVTATIQMAGESKKVTIKGEVKVSDAVITAVAKDGRKLDLMFLRNSISGTFDGCQIEGTRNWLSSSGSSAEKSAAEAVVNRFAGNYTIAYGDEQGWNGLSLAVMKKGKCKISGKLANGKGVATTSQMIIGEDYCCVPVICAKKGVELSLSIYFPNNGKKPFVFGFYNAVIASVSELGSGRTFRMGGGIYDPLDMYEIEDGYLPEGVSVEQRGKKWIVADGVKPGKIKMDREEGVYDANESENPSGLKLTFTAKTGLFKGTFKVYGINDKGKLKSFTATVNGIVVDGCGYGTATVKKFGSVPITIE